MVSDNHIFITHELLSAKPTPYKANLVGRLAA